MHASITQMQDSTEYQAMVNRLVTRATREHPNLAERLTRAQALALQPNEPVVYWADGTATVRSQRGGDVTYTVDGPRCNCPDATHRQRLCVHSLAAGLVRRARKEVRDEAQRRRDYGATHAAPGTPFAVVACGRCGITAELDARGQCEACHRERVAQPPIRLALVQAARQQKQGA